MGGWLTVVSVGSIPDIQPLHVYECCYVDTKDANCREHLI